MDYVQGFVDRFVYPAMQSSVSGPTYDIAGTQCYVRHECAFSSRAIVYVHGNSTTLEDLRQSAVLDVLSTECAATVVALEYPGYGDMAGVERGTGIAADTSISDRVASVINELARRNVEEIYVVGRSIGSGIALSAITKSPAATQSVKGIVLISPFQRLSAVFPGVIRCLASGRLDNEQAMSELSSSMPVLLLHGKSDDLVPCVQSLELAGAHSNAEVNLLDNMGHVLTLPIMTRLCPFISKFIQKHTSESSAGVNLEFDVFQPKSPSCAHEPS